MSILSLKNVCKGFGEGKGRTEVLKNINLEVEEGEFVAIVGFSGSGKSTLLHQLSGLAMPDSGEVLLHGKPIVGAGPDRGVVFQNYSLLPWLSVFQNIGLGVDQVFAGWSREKRHAHILHYIELVGLGHASRKKPSELSGGMRQRVSLARALATNPEMLLLDEPLSALDALTRGSLQTEIQSIWAKDTKTVIMITNDVDEAILLADRVIPLTPGPGATLGPEFRVDLARPRDKAHLNQNAKFQKIRNDVVRTLLEMRDKQRKSQQNVVPMEPAILKQIRAKQTRKQTAA